MNKSKRFWLMTVSNNANAFCLYGHIFVAEDGEAWETAHHRTIDAIEVGSYVDVPLDAAKEPMWHMINHEIPYRKPNFPNLKVLREWIESEKAKKAAATSNAVASFQDDYTMTTAEADALSDKAKKNRPKIRVKSLPEPKS